MSEKTQKPDVPEAKGQKESRVSIINGVKTPLGFFTLGILVVEAIFAVLVSQVEGQDRTLLIFGMISALILLFVFVAFLALYRPAALQAQAASPLRSEAGASQSGIDRLSQITAAVVGDWTLIVAPRGDSAEARLSVAAAPQDALLRGPDKLHASVRIA